MLKFGENKYNFFPSIGLKLTAACNGNCPFCCEPKRNQKVYPLGNFIKITKNLYRWGTKRLCLTGGEPLLYPSLTELLQHTKKLGFFNLLLTCDGKELIKNIIFLKPYVDAVRLSIHELGINHDTVVGKKGAFAEMENAVRLLNENRIRSFVTTVVTTVNLNSIFSIADWCVNNNINTFFIFGLMKSGKGNDFIKSNGEVSEKEISFVIDELNRKYSKETLEVIYYDYRKNAECILIYGDGKVVVDPYPASLSFQLEIGNVLTENSNVIIERFLKNPKNLIGHHEHLKQNFDKLI
jgi:MoaA/NifB/PqqE/SkfB family radical SAM enzyme